MAKKEKKRPVAHKEGIRLLERKKPWVHIGTILEQYERGTVVPSEDIRKFIRTLTGARDAVCDKIESLIADLEKQLNESNQKEAKEKGWIN